MPKSVTPKNIASIKLYTKEYRQFAGVDFSTDETQVKEYRSPDAQNLVSDIAGYPEKRVGWRTLHVLDKPINGLIYCFLRNRYIFAHAADKLYKLNGDGTHTLIYTGLKNDRSTHFVHDNNLYILDGQHYLVVKETDGGLTVTNVKDGECFIPTTVIGAPATGGGTPFEAVNLLSSKRINSMVGDGFSVVFYLDSQDIDGVDSVKVEGEEYIQVNTWTHDKPAFLFTVPAVPEGDKFFIEAGGRRYIAVAALDGDVAAPSILTQGTVTAYELTETEKEVEEKKYPQAIPYTQEEGEKLPSVNVSMNGNVFKLTSNEYTVDTGAGTVIFALPPSPWSGGGGVDNVVIQFEKNIEGHADRIAKCSIAATYGYNSDNRFFVSGNPDYKNYDWQSGLDDPTYFPDTGYTAIGSDASAIMGYLKQYGSLMIIKEDNEQDAEVFLRTASMSDSGNIIFPVQQGIKGIGAVSKYAFATLRDDPLFLSKTGVYAIVSQSVTQERSLQDRSTYINTKLKAHTGLSDAVATIWNGLYVLCVNGVAYVADGRRKSGSSTTESFSYEWFYWTNIPARVLLENDGKLYFGTADGKVCMFNSDISKLEKYSDDGEPIIARWTTKSDDMGIFTRRKTITKKGCAVLIKPFDRSSVKIYVLTEKTHRKMIKEAFMDIFNFADIDFSRWTFNTKDTAQVVPFNKKAKKFNTVQFVFENDALNEGFGVFGCQVQYVIGNYVK